MPDLYSDDNGNRVILRHRGPAGPGVPAGGTTGQIYRKASEADYDGEWAAPPTVANAVLFTGTAPLDGEITLFSGVTGKVIKASGMTLADIAATFSSKVDKDGTKVLSDVNFSAANAAKLAALDPEHFLGAFTTSGALNAAHPTASSGDYATIEAAGKVLAFYSWDSVGGVWTRIGAPYVLAGSAVANVLFTVPGTWTAGDCHVYTAAEVARVANAVQTTDLVNMGVGVRAFGALSFFDTVTPVTVVITSQTLTGGMDDMIKITPATTLSTHNIDFDNGGANDGRLRYVGTVSPQLFQVTLELSVDANDGVSHILICALGKNGAIEADSRVVHMMSVAANSISVTSTAIISLATNQYLEAFLGDATGTSSPAVYSLKISAIKL